MKRVFLSSVVKDFEHFREAAERAIEGIYGYTCVRMERFSSSPEPALDVCLNALGGCDYYVGILGSRYGSLHSASQCSYTEAEYMKAGELGIPRLMFLAGIDAVDQEPEDLASRQREFKKRVSQDHFRTEFQSADGLRAEVTQALANCAQRAFNREDSENETWLLIPFVTAQAGYDTGVAITNPTSRRLDSRLGRESAPSTTRAKP